MSGEYHKQLPEDPNTCEHGMTACPPCGFGLPPVDPWPGVAYWSCDEGAERLEHESDEAAVDAFLDETYDAAKQDRPASVKVFGWARQAISVDSARLLEDVLETLDETFGDPDGDVAEATPAMTEAAKVLAKVIEKEFLCWLCQRVPESDHDVPVRWDAKYEPHIGEAVKS